MRAVFFVLLVSTAVTSCGATSEDAVRLELRTKAPSQLLATCVSQDFDGAFPRLFPAEKARSLHAFKTYDGIEIVIGGESGSSVITLRAPTPLTTEQISYVRKCVRMSEAA